MKLTIGMASYNNCEQVWNTVQDLRMYHDLTDTEILVVDNYNDDALRAFIASTGSADIRYELYTEARGTAPPRNKVFDYARGTWVLCIDSHIKIVPGAIARFRAWCEAHPDCMDLLQGPILWDCLKSGADAFNPVWEGEMFGTWRHGDVSKIEREPYEIPMMGLGLFGCRRDAWLGFNPEFRGFGGEEGYIHEKYRQAGRKTICLPWLQWTHWFTYRGKKQFPVPYPLLRDEKIRNYEIGLAELNQDPSEMRVWFGVGGPKVKNVQIDTNARCGSQCWFCPVRYIPRPPGQVMPQELFESILDGITQAMIMGSVAADWQLWLSSYNDVLLDPLLEERLQALRQRGLRFTCLTNGIGIRRNVELLHRYSDVIGGFGVNLPAGDEESYSLHTGNPPETFGQIIAGLTALYGRDPEYYGRVMSVCVNGGYDSQPGLSYPLEDGDTDRQVKTLADILPMYRVTYARPLADRAGHLKPYALDNGIDRPAKGCNCNGDRIIEWAHINSFGQMYACCQDYEEKTIYADLREVSFHKAASMGKSALIRQTRDMLCRRCAFGG